MVKRAQGRTFLLSRKNFKSRYFILTNYELSYGKTKTSKPLCTIPVQDIRGVEKLQEESFRMSYVRVFVTVATFRPRSRKQHVAMSTAVLFLISG